MSRRIGTVLVLGGGQIGSGLARACARGGLRVTVVEPEAEARSSAEDETSRWLERKGVPGAVTYVADLPDLDDVDLAVEATPEDRATKEAVLRSIADARPDDSMIVATTTSSLPIAELGAAAGVPDLIGLHVFHPVTVMPVVELIAGSGTAPQAIDAVDALVRGPLSKTAVRAPDRPGFIVNALIIPYVAAAVRLVDETGVAPADVDTLMKGALGHPLGPLELADYMGLDTLSAIATVLHEADPSREPRPAGSLADHVSAGQLGRKTGRGFYVH